VSLSVNLCLYFLSFVFLWSNKIHYYLRESCEICGSFFPSFFCLSHHSQLTTFFLCLLSFFVVNNFLISDFLNLSLDLSLSILYFIFFCVLGATFPPKAERCSLAGFLSFLRRQESSFSVFNISLIRSDAGGLNVKRFPTNRDSHSSFSCRVAATESSRWMVLCRVRCIAPFLRVLSFQS
jgi:hypothetical protein